MKTIFKFSCVSCPEWFKLISSSLDDTARMALFERGWIDLPAHMGKKGSKNPALCPKCSSMVMGRIAMFFAKGHRA